jgi:ADP-ribosyl-[dinitrogen reductase] hydrolase
MPTRSERIEGGILGLLVGDALGVPYEFKRPEQLPVRARIEFEPTSDFARSHRGVPPGTWSDDGAQALCLLASLLECRVFDVSDFARRLVDWYAHGYLAVDGEVFDVGIQTQSALAAIRRGTPPLEGARSDEQSNGNGALMRVLPLALWHQGSDAQLVADARLSSRVTHGHIRSQLCCALYCLWARRIMQDTGEPWGAALTALETVVALDREAHAELTDSLLPELGLAGRGSGYVVDSLRSARSVLGHGDYQDVVRSAIQLGGDTDTTAAIAGGIAGMLNGVEGIPLRWRQALRGRELADPLIARLLQR